MNPCTDYSFSVEEVVYGQLNDRVITVSQFGGEEEVEG